jgi:hypothetical protein
MSMLLAPSKRRVLFTGLFTTQLLAHFRSIGSAAIRRQSRAQLGLEMKPRSIRHILFVTTPTPAVCAILITFAVGTSLPDVREQRGRRRG